MKTTGAIFDLDGTLVDSMWMWRRAFGDVLEDFVIDMTPDFFKKVEAISLFDGCVVCVKEFNLPLTAQELYERFVAHVQYVYTHDIAIIAGAKDFLQELYDAGIPMAIASSTPGRALGTALRAQGIEHYFQALVSTEDVGGADKDKPDVYLEALRRLGTDKASTWVFEDAEFGARTARKAGFPVVALFNGKDGRSIDVMKAHSDIFARDYRELSLTRICDYERMPSGDSPFEKNFEKSFSAERKCFSALIVDGSPAVSSSALIGELAAEASYVVAADRGVAACKEAGVVPDIVCGDFDSINGSLKEETAHWLRKYEVPIIAFPPDKYVTDLSLALDAVAHEAIRRGAPLSLTVTCASGGRLDHELGVIGLLARRFESGGAVRVVEDDVEARILTAKSCDLWKLSCQQGRTLSVIALREETIVSETGMKWDLDAYALPLLSDEGVSNVVQDEHAHIRCEKGVLLAMLLKTGAGA